MFLNHLVSHEIMIASLEQVEFRFLVILESLMPVKMIRIDIEQDAYIIRFLQSLQHIARYLKHRILILLG